jgi:3-hydroxymyristoyl/3-hydroxydecanoyl-(acyl carrier protein) dehydratase
VADLDLTVDACAGAAPCPLTARLIVPPAHPVLAGHFPGAPLVPGVLLLDAVRLAWERASGRGAAMVGVDDARWLAPVAPGVAVTLHAQVHAAAAGELTVDGEWRAAAGRVATFTVRLAERGGGGAAAAGGPGRS